MRGSYSIRGGAAQLQRSARSVAGYSRHGNRKSFLRKEAIMRARIAPLLSEPTLAPFDGGRPVREPPPPRHELPDSDAGRPRDPRSRSHRTPGADATAAEKPDFRFSSSSRPGPSVFTALRTTRGLALSPVFARRAPRRIGLALSLIGPR